MNSPEEMLSSCDSGISQIRNHVRVHFMISEEKKTRNLCFILGTFSRNSAVFYWKSANLSGSRTVFYSPIENSRARVAPRPVVFLNFWL